MRQNHLQSIFGVIIVVIILSCTLVTIAIFVNLGDPDEELKRPHDYDVDGVTSGGFILGGSGYSEYISESAGYSYKFTMNYIVLDGPSKGDKGEKSFTIICDSKDGPSSSLYTLIREEKVDDTDCKVWSYVSSQYVLEFAMDQKLIVHSFTIVIDEMKFTGNLDDGS